MRLIVTAAVLAISAPVALAQEAPSTTTVAPDTAAVVTTGESVATSQAPLTAAPQKAKSTAPYGDYEGCHGSRRSSAKLIM